MTGPVYSVVFIDETFSPFFSSIYTVPAGHTAVLRDIFLNSFTNDGTYAVVNDNLGVQAGGGTFPTTGPFQFEIADLRQQAFVAGATMQVASDATTCSARLSGYLFAN